MFNVQLELVNLKHRNCYHKKCWEKSWLDDAELLD